KICGNLDTILFDKPHKFDGFGNRTTARRYAKCVYRNERMDGHELSKVAILDLTVHNDTGAVLFQEKYDALMRGSLLPSDLTMPRPILDVEVGGLALNDADTYGRDRNGQKWMHDVPPTYAMPPEHQGSNHRRSV